MLKQLIQPMLTGGQHSCSCYHAAEQFRKDITVLHLQCKDLENKIAEKEQIRLKLHNEARYLLERLHRIETVLLQKEPEIKEVIHMKFEPKDVARHKHTDTEANAGEGLVDENKQENENSVQITGPEEKEKITQGPWAGPLLRNTYISKYSQSGRSRVSDLEDISKVEDISMAKHVLKNESDKKGIVGRSDKDNGRDSKHTGKSRGAVIKPNFMKPQQQKATVVKQEVELVYDGRTHWRSIFQMELDRNRAIFQSLTGVLTMICLDISESMTESNAWTEAYTFLSEYLSGLEKMSKSHDLKTEYVALITFGHDTKIQMGYTDRYDDVRRRLDDINLGGPTQMYGGVMLTLAKSLCTARHVERVGNGIPVFSKIIIVTDGRPTESDLIAGPDVADTSKVDETKAYILQEMENFQRAQKDVYFVAVGNPDLDFVNTMATCSGGMLLDYRHGKRFSRRHYLATQFSRPSGMMTGILTSDSDDDSDDGLSVEDMEDLLNIQERLMRHVSVKIRKGGGRHHYGENNSSQLPSIGSRVRRGPDWNYGTQDNYGPGTVIGHDDDGNGVWVEWDTDGHQNIYVYGSGRYDVLLIDEARKLKPGEIIAVGCEVKPGIDWNYSEGKMNHGVVIKVDKSNRKATIRWTDGKREDYTYGDDGLQEIKINTGAKDRGESCNATDSRVGSSNEWKPPPALTIEEFETRKTRNKNKNLR
ncbi:uncharacterized protein LOC123554777 isoform X2 [Mercenaria mercenaria]|nr:uncharacterized protein LOC123554777 isoform X2 [Mercenaria mercenaria]